MNAATDSIIRGGEEFEELLKEVERQRESLGFWGRAAAKLSRDIIQVRKDYNELIYAVARKYPNETRHQTALRYIRQAEEGKSEPAEEAKFKKSFVDGLKDPPSHFVNDGDASSGIKAIERQVVHHIAQLARNFPRPTNSP